MCGDGGEADRAADSSGRLRAASWVAAVRRASSYFERDGSGCGFGRRRGKQRRRKGEKGKKEEERKKRKEGKERKGFFFFFFFFLDYGLEE